jgi:hypothetical protein
VKRKPGTRRERGCKTEHVAVKVTPITKALWSGVAAAAGLSVTVMLERAVDRMLTTYTAEDMRGLAVELWAMAHGDDAIEDAAGRMAERMRMEFSGPMQ